MHTYSYIHTCTQWLDWEHTMHAWKCVYKLWIQWGNLFFFESLKNKFPHCAYHTMLFDLRFVMLIYQSNIDKKKLWKYIKQIQVEKTLHDINIIPSYNCFSDSQDILMNTVRREEILVSLKLQMILHFSTPDCQWPIAEPLYEEKVKS